MPYDIITFAIQNNVDPEIIEYLLKAGAQVGSAREAVKELLEDEHDNQEYQEILELLDTYDPEAR